MRKQMRIDWTKEILSCILISVSAQSVSGNSYSNRQVNWTLLDIDEWWGSNHSNTDFNVRPTKIYFHNEMTEDLQHRLLKHGEFTPPLKDAGFTYGFNSDTLPYWMSYWANNYSFEERENFLNQYPQYETNIQGLKIHFIWVKPETPGNKTVLPLLLLHGWPGSIREFYEAIPILTKDEDGRDFSVEVIVPCLPGFGFSDGATRPGLGVAQIAIVLRNLMKRLGHSEFYLQGGDWGGVICSLIATLFPEEILGFHTNYAIVPTLPALGLQLVGSLQPSIVVQPELEDRMYPLSKVFGFLMEELGYFHLQATKPDTIGIALTDSPAGLLAYIFEKFSTGVTRENRFLKYGGLHNTFTPEQLIDNLMIYWSTTSITTSMRLYAESYSKKHIDLGLNGIPTPVPTWALQVKHELTYQSPNILRLKYPNLMNVTVLDYGGHFFALEHPEVFADDVLKALDSFRKWNK